MHTSRVTRQKKTKRLDALLVESGYVDSRERAKRLIMAGNVFVNGHPVNKPGKNISPKAEIQVKNSDIPYVSRGGLKLEKALQNFDVEVRDKVAIDVGASTGGFTDCLLQHGAKFVYAVDVGYGQLAWKLRIDPRVKVFERTNIRYVEKSNFDREIEIATIDVSFISLRKVLFVAKKLLSKSLGGKVGVSEGKGDRSGDIIALIKPQFEAGKEFVARGGVVKDPNVHRQVILDVAYESHQGGLTTVGVSYSPIMGPAGNIEYLIHFRIGQDVNTFDADNVVSRVVLEAHQKAEGKKQGG